MLIQLCRASFFLFLSISTMLAHADSHKQDFIQAKKALRSGDIEQFQALKDSLDDHPLAANLEYYYIRRNFDSLDKSKVKEFMKRHPHSAMTAKLRRKWMASLLKQEKWQQVVELYKAGMNKTTQCDYLNALQKTGQFKASNPLIKRLWLSGRDRPDNCDPVFKHWLSISDHSEDLLWQRFELALKKYNFKLAKYVSTQMTATKHRQALAIIRLYSHPSLVTKSSYINNQPSGEVVSYGIARMARRSPAAAINLWQKLKRKYDFNAKQEQRIFQAIALKYALRKNPKSSKWFRKVVGRELDPVYQEWLIRSALYHGDWALARDAIAAMPGKQRYSSRWQYWYGRALAKLGDKAKAQAVFNRIANDRNYHGFMASKHVKDKIKVKHHALEISDAEITEVQQLPGFKRAKMLFELKQRSEASSELYYLIKNSDIKRQYIVNKLVDNWGWHSQALRLSRYTKHQDDITLRFPLRFHAKVTQQAKKRDLNPALIYAIIRQESFFTPHARSHAGAVGLMQLMPATAYRTSKQFKLAYRGSKDLLNKDKNIQLGSAHLRKLHEQLNDHPILVIAAYNAGKRAVSRWLPKNKVIPADIWIETIPFYETRKYLRHVIAYYVVYQQRLGQVPNLDNIMRSIK